MAGTPCWEHVKCGRQEQCPAYPNRGFDCWNVAGTWCRGEKQGSYEQKVERCRRQCEYDTGVMQGSIKVT